MRLRNCTLRSNAIQIGTTERLPCVHHSSEFTKVLGPSIVSMASFMLRSVLSVCALVPTWFVLGQVQFFLWVNEQSESVGLLMLKL
eukprot:SAG31_NODE_1226_length_9252_cov_6.871627_4_plen_86_part_00